MDEQPVQQRGGKPRSIFTDEVLHSIPFWLELGADRHDIADALGTTVGSLEVTCSVQGISLRASNAGIRRGLGKPRWDKLRAAAVARDMSVAQLTVDLMSKIIDDELIGAVLDDGL